MANLIRVNVDGPEDLLALYGATAKVRLERDTTSAFAAPTEISTQTIVAGTSQYEFNDTTGTTAHWYRSRYSNLAATLFSDYSAPFQAGAFNTYATLESLREFLQLPDTSRDNVLLDLLRRVTDKININLGFDFFRHPQVSGEETWTVDGDNGNMIREPRGIVSLSLVRQATYTGQSYASLAAGDWKLRWPAQEGGPYLAVLLTGVANYRYFYAGYDTVEFTGVRGYATIPPAIEQATLMWAADLYRLGAGGGSPLSATGEEFGQERFVGGMPRFTWETVEDYRKRHMGALVA